MRKQPWSWDKLTGKEIQTPEERVLLQSIVALSSHPNYRDETPEEIYEAQVRNAQGLYQPTSDPEGHWTPIFETVPQNQEKGSETGTTSELFDAVRKAAMAQYEAVLAQRDMILKAFIAETGLKPSEIVQVEQRTPEGSIWYLKSRSQSCL